MLSETKTTLTPNFVLQVKATTTACTRIRNGNGRARHRTRASVKSEAPPPARHNRHPMFTPVDLLAIGQRSRDRFSIVRSEGSAIIPRASRSQAKCHLAMQLPPFRLPFGFPFDRFV
jgi:hypothetical protein